jgi:hypothetical protein
VRASTLNLEIIGTSADVDFAQMRDFQSGFEYLSRSKTFLHSLGRKRSVMSGYVRPGADIKCLQIQDRFTPHQTVPPKSPPAVSAST